MVCSLVTSLRMNFFPKGTEILRQPSAELSSFLPAASSWTKVLALIALMGRLAKLAQESQIMEKS